LDAENSSLPPAHAASVKLSKSNISNFGSGTPYWIPRSLEEVNAGQTLGFGPNLDADHPGFLDPSYKQRRINIAQVAKTHVLGQPIPSIDYTLEETAVWATVMRGLEPLYKLHACSAFLRTFPLFNLTPTSVPQLEDLSSVLRSTTGWQIRPTAGLLHPRDFLAGLAFCTFHSTQYIRHASNPQYTPEPDLVHEVLGHVPMLADPAFCTLAQNIGIASLGADDATIWHLTNVYWYTVEFGLVKEGGQVKAFGAGVLSSIGEMHTMAEGKAALVPFDPFAKLPKMNYKDGYQKRYFVLESFEDGASKVREYCEHVRSKLPADVRAAVERVVLPKRQ